MGDKRWILLSIVDCRRLILARSFQRSMVQVTIRMKLNAKNTAQRLATVAQQTALKIVSLSVSSLKHSHFYSLRRSQILTAA